jgi:hypothetical protein
VITATAPNACGGDAASLAAAIRLAENGTPPVPTSVISLEADYDVRPLGDATSLPFQLGPSDATADLVAALLRVSNGCNGPPHITDCTYPQLPPPPGVRPPSGAVVPVLLAPAGVEYYPEVASLAACTDQGGYTRDAEGAVTLCPCTCARRGFGLLSILYPCD